MAQATTNETRTQRHAPRRANDTGHKRGKSCARGVGRCTPGSRADAQTRAKHPGSGSRATGWHPLQVPLRHGVPHQRRAIQRRHDSETLLLPASTTGEGGRGGGEGRTGRRGGRHPRLVDARPGSVLPIPLPRNRLPQPLLREEQNRGEAARLAMPIILAEEQGREPIVGHAGRGICAAPPHPSRLPQPSPGEGRGTECATPAASIGPRAC